MSPPNAASGPAASTGQHLFIVASGGAGWTSVEAVHPDDGLARWTYEPRRQLSDVACNNGTVFVSTHVPHTADKDEPARIVALRARDGAELWRMEPAQIRYRMAVLRLVCGLRIAFGQFSLAHARWEVRSLRLAGRVSLMADGDMLFACANSIMFAFNSETGALRWMFPTLSGQQRRLLAAHGGRIYVASVRHGIQALDAGTGRALWSYERSRGGRILAVGEARIYLHATTGRSQSIVTLSVRDGTQDRSFLLRSDQGTLVAVSDTSVAYLLRDQRLCAVRLDDERELWRTERLEDMPDGTTPALALPPNGSGDQALFYGYMRVQTKSRMSCVGALDPRTGATLWRWDGPERPLPVRGGPSLTIGLGNVYVSTGDGIYALSGSDGHLLWHTPAGFHLVTAPMLVAIKRA